MWSSFTFDVNAIDQFIFSLKLTLCKMRPYLELFWSVFPRIWTEHGEIRTTSPYSVRMRKMRTKITPNTDTFHAVWWKNKCNFLSSFRKLKNFYWYNCKFNSFTLIYLFLKSHHQCHKSCKSWKHLYFATSVLFHSFKYYLWVDLFYCGIQRFRDFRNIWHNALFQIYELLKAEYHSPISLVNQVGN